jgi:hypothetical protein
MISKQARRHAERLSLIIAEIAARFVDFERLPAITATLTREAEELQDRELERALGIARGLFQRAHMCGLCAQDLQSAFEVSIGRCESGRCL